MLDSSNGSEAGGKLLNKTSDDQKPSSSDRRPSSNDDLEEEFFGTGTKPGNNGGDLPTTVSLIFQFMIHNFCNGLQENIMAASTPPMSPGKKILRAAGSPGRYIKMKMREGSNPASVFALVVCCLGSGMLTIPYSFLENGFALGSGFVIVGAVLSIFTGYLVVYASDKTNGSCYEEIALAVFGPGWQKFTSACMIPTNGGFVLTYYVLFKSFAPHTLTLLKLELPGWCDESKVGQIFWAVLFLLVCIPATLPRKLSELRFASLLSVMLSIYVVLVIVFNAFLCKGSSESVSAGFKAGHEKTEITANGIFGSLPLILFSYMYQPNIPQIY